METGPPGQPARQASPALLRVTGAPVRCSLLLPALSSIMSTSKLCSILTGVQHSILLQTMPAADMLPTSCRVHLALTMASKEPSLFG